MRYCRKQCKINSFLVYFWTGQILSKKICLLFICWIDNYILAFYRNKHLLFWEVINSYHCIIFPKLSYIIWKSFPFEKQSFWRKHFTVWVGLDWLESEWNVLECAADGSEMSKQTLNSDNFPGWAKNWAIKNKATENFEFDHWKMNTFSVHSMLEILFDKHLANIILP